MSATLIDPVYPPKQPHRWQFSVGIAIAIHIHALLFIEFMPLVKPEPKEKEKILMVSLSLAPKTPKKQDPETDKFATEEQQKKTQEKTPTQNPIDKKLLPKPKTEAKKQDDLKKEMKAKPEPKEEPKAKPEPKEEPKTKPEPKEEPKTKPEPKEEPKTKPEPKEEPKVKPEPKKEQIMPEQLPSKELKPLKEKKSTIAFDDAKQQLEKAPENAQFKSATNSEAANPEPQKSIKDGEAFSKGDHPRVTNFGKLGETETKAARTESDTSSGSTQQQGVKEIGTPPPAEDKLANMVGPNKALENSPPTPTPPLEQIKEIAQPNPAPKELTENQNTPPEKQPPTNIQQVAEAQADSEKLAEMTPDSDAKTLLKNPPQELSNPDPIASDGEQLAPDPLKPADESEVVNQKLANSSQVVPEPTPKNKQAPTEFEIEKSLAENADDQAEDTPTAPAEPTLDPEMLRAMKIADEASDPEGGLQSTLMTPGQVGRDGTVGQEGNGQTRVGSSKSTTDLNTFNTASSAAKRGKLAFTTKADPKASYLQKYIQRIGLKWKANLAAQMKKRIEVGDVDFLITIKRNGEIANIKLKFRSPGISDHAVVICKKVLKDAAPLPTFPSALSNKEQITVPFKFEYY